jgi:hypothetical protein
VSSGINNRVAAGNKRARGKVTTTNATATAVVIQRGGLTMPNNSAWVVVARVVGRRSDTGSEVAGYDLRAVVKRGANAASTAVVGSASQTVLGEDTAAWDAALGVDTTAGGPKVTVTGEAGKTIQWTAQFSIVAA